MNRSLLRTNLSTLFEFIYSIIKVLIGVFYKPRTTKELYGHRKIGYLKPILKSSVYFFIFVAWASFTKLSAQTCSVNAGVAITYCPGEQMTLYGNATGDAQLSTVRWTQLSGPITAINQSNQLTTTAGIAVSGANYTFQISVVCGDNQTVTNNVTYTVRSPLQPNLGPDQTITTCVTPNTLISVSIPNQPVNTVPTYATQLGGNVYFATTYNYIGGSFFTINMTTQYITSCVPNIYSPKFVFENVDAVCGKSKDTFQVEVTNRFGCTDTDEMQVIISAVPSCVATDLDSQPLTSIELCLGESIEFVVDCPNGTPELDNPPLGNLTFNRNTGHWTFESTGGGSGNIVFTYPDPDGTGGCPEGSLVIPVTVQNLPFLACGDDIVICDDMPLQTNISAPLNDVTFHWTLFSNIFKVNMTDIFLIFNSKLYL